MSAHEHPAAEDWWRIQHSDAEGERPFTDFGQFGYGRLDRRVLWQDIYWVDISGAPHFLVDMPPRYRANVIDFLRGGAAEWWSEQVVCLAVDAATRILAAADEPTTMRALTRLDTLLTMGPENWMDSSPLMKRLRGLQYSAQTGA